MAHPEQFTDMAAVRREQDRLRALRDERMNTLNGHWENVHDPAFQRWMGMGIVKHTLRSTFSWKSAKGMASGISPEMIGGLAAMVLGGRAKTAAGKALAMGLSAAVPFLSGRLKSKGTGHLIAEVDTSWERVKAYVRERIEARRQ